ncbi:MAG TPA: hypothetical protein VEN81_09810, partial [Planctomycetota bacterium]|nr:hypothetical protein [Planctomycetota bacterium]
CGGGGGGGGSFIGQAKIHYPDLTTGLTTEVTVAGGLGGICGNSGLPSFQGQNGFAGAVVRALV